MKIKVVLVALFSLFWCGWSKIPTNSGLVSFVRSTLGLNTVQTRRTTNAQSQTQYSFVSSRNRLILRDINGYELSLSVGKSGIIAQKSTQRKSLPLEQKGSQTVDGLFGLYKLPAGYFAAIVKSSKECNSFRNINLRIVTKVELHRVPSVTPLSRPRNATEVSIQHEKAVYALSEAFRQHSFYFTRDGYDITRTFQSNVMSSGQVEGKAVSGKVTVDIPAKTCTSTPCERFFWNLNALKPLLEQNCSEFVIPMVNAWVSSVNISYGKEQFTLGLISRRSRRRQGPR